MPTLFGLRLVARKPRRALLSAASIAVTITGIVTMLAFHAESRRARLAAAQVLSALPGAMLGVPLGTGLFKAAAGVRTVLPAWWLIAAVLGTLVAVAGLSAVLPRVGARRSVAVILQAEAV